MGIYTFNPTTSQPKQIMERSQIICLREDLKMNGINTSFAVQRKEQLTQHAYIQYINNISFFLGLN